MSDLRPKPQVVKLEDKEYPMQFTLNVIDDIQDHFDIAIEDLEKLFNNKKKVMGNLRYILTLLINEGLDCEADETGERKPHVDERFIGRKIKPDNMNEVISGIYKAFSASKPKSEDEDEESPNAQSA